MPPRRAELSKSDRAPRRRTSAGRLVLAVVAIAVVVVSLPGVAVAHAVLLSLTPESGELVLESPSEVELQFNEPVSIASDAIVVLDPTGARIGGIEAVADGSSVRAELPELLQDGSYTVGWKAVSSDGHPVRGAYLFHLRDQTLSEPIGLDGTDTSIAVDIVRAGGTALALFALIAASGPLLARRSGRSRPTVSAVWPWNAAALGTLLVLSAAVMSVGSSLGESVSVTLDTSSGRVALVAWLLSLVGVVFAAARVQDRFLAVVVALTAIAIGLGGHAVSLPPVALSATLTVAHVLAAIVWILGLVWLVRRLGPSEEGGDGAGPERGMGAVAALSPWALGSVLVLAVSGTVLVLDRVPLAELTSSSYGRISLVKVLLLAAAAVLAMLNRFRFAPALVVDEQASGAQQQQRSDRLRASVGVEVIVLSLALVAGTALAQVSPPGVGATEGGPFLDRLPFGEGQVELTIEPGTRGTNEVHVIAFDDDGRLMDVESLEVLLTLPEEDLGPLEPEMIEITTGHSTSYAEFPLAGSWEVEVIGRLNRFESLEASFEVDIGR